MVRKTKQQPPDNPVVTDPAPTANTGAAYGVTIEKEWSDRFIGVLDKAPEAKVDGWTVQITFVGEIDNI